MNPKMLAAAVMLTVVALAFVPLVAAKSGGEGGGKGKGGGASAKPACSDGRDNDGDGYTDYPDDPGCSASGDSSERGTAACDDGTDNDGDGAVDQADADCSGPTDASEDSPPPYGPCIFSDQSTWGGLLPPGTCVVRCDPYDGACWEVACTFDGIQNGWPFSPWGCPTPPTPPVTGCNDGVDNDGDGFIDYPLDLGCRGPDDGSEDCSGEVFFDSWNYLLCDPAGNLERDFLGCPTLAGCVPRA